MTKKKDPKDIKPSGAPTKYLIKYNEQAFRLALLGSTNEDIAKFFNISESTLYEWCIKHPKFAESIKAGGEEADTKVAKSLYQRALGYEHKAQKIVLDRSGEWKVKDYIERYPPSEVAAIFWLKNRKPKDWREKLDIEQKTIIVKSEDDEPTGE